MNIFLQFIKSIYSPQTVSKFRFQGVGKTMLYVFVMMLITVSITAFQLGSEISSAVHHFHKVLKEELPNFEFKNSILTSDLKEPLYVKIEGDSFIFDTTGTLTATDVKEQYTQALALLQTEAVFIADGVAESFQYQEMGNLTLTKKQLEELTETIIDLLPLIISIVVIIFYLVLTTLKYLGIFFLSIIGLIIKRNVDLSLSYKQVWILSAYAVTLPTLFFAITDGLYIYIPFSLTLYWIVACIMLYLIFKETPKGKDNLEKTE